jgi:hypothetical protein
MTTARDAGAPFEHTIGGRGRMTIRLASAELWLRGGVDDRVIVRTLDGKPFPDSLVFEPVDGGLTMREKDVFGPTFGLDRRTVQLDIQLPAGAELEINTASGWIETDGLGGEQRFKTASGEVRLRRASGAIELAAVSGDATIDLDGSAALAVRTVSGQIEVRGGRIDMLRLATTSGDIRVESELSKATDHSIETLSGDVELVADGGLRVDTRTVSGDVSSDLAHRTEGRMGRRALIVGDGAVRLAFRSVSGDLRIRDRSRAESSGPSSDRASAPETTESDTTTEPAPGDDERMTILRALERGELDVAAAMARLAELDEDASDD